MIIENGNGFTNQACSSSEGYQHDMLQNRALKNYARIRLKCSSANAEKSVHFPQRVSIPCALRIKSESKIHPLRSHADAPHTFSAFRVRTPFGCERSNSGMPVNVSYYGLLSGLCSTYYGSISRSFSQIPRAGTRNHVVMTEGGGSERNNSSKTFNKHWKWKKAFAAHKGNATSTEELASSSSEGKAAALEDVNLSSLNRQIVKDNENSLVSKSTQTPMGKEKAKRQSRSKKKQNQSSSASAPTDAADMPNTSGKNSLAKETRNNKSKQSPILSEVRSLSSRLIEF
ncbi:hypothetical protein Pfo_015578 [Paulownia fortunei]|nr:hypothetical protein Pfo_015578 [Paulownia fortunei]